MDRRQYEPTEKQITQWQQMRPAEMPGDDEFKQLWARSHHGVERGWGMAKRNWIAQHADDELTQTVDYMLGLWQGRIDALRGSERMPTPEYHANAYEYGYAHGYDGFESFWRGCDAQTRENLTTKYGQED